MPLGMWAFVGWMALVTIIGIGFLLWGLSTGQFKDIEEAKYRMLTDREPEPWPARAKHGGASALPHENGGAK